MAGPDYLRLIDTPGVGCYDVTPLFADAAAFAALLDDLSEPFGAGSIDIEAGIDRVEARTPRSFKPWYGRVSALHPRTTKGRCAAVASGSLFGPICRLVPSGWGWAGHARTVDRVGLVSAPPAPPSPADRAHPPPVARGVSNAGFILGAALATRLGTGFVPVRKGGKLPVPADSASFVDYTGGVKALKLRRGAILPGARVLLVDEWIETGAQIRAAIGLIEGQRGAVAGIATIAMDDNAAAQALRVGYHCHALWLLEPGHDEEHA